MLLRVIITLPAILVAGFADSSGAQDPAIATRLLPSEEIVIATTALRHVLHERDWTRVVLEPRTRPHVDRGVGPWGDRLPDPVLDTFRNRLGIEVRSIRDTYRCHEGEPGTCRLMDADGMVAIGSLRQLDNGHVSLEVTTWYLTRSSRQPVSFFDFRVILKRCDDNEGWCVVEIQPHRIS